MLRKLLIATLIIPSLTGCALTTATTPLTYKPSAGVMAVPGAKNVVVHVVVKNDKKHKRISRKKDGFGIPMASIYAKGPISKTVQDAFQKELTARGFGISGSGLVAIIATVNELHSTFELGMFEGESVAHLSMVVEVMTKNGKEFFSKNITSTGETGAMVAAGHDASEAVDRALHAGMHALFADPAFIHALFTAQKASQ